MPVPKDLTSDVAAILAHRHDNGGDFWASPEGGIGVGNPFSTLESALMLAELGMSPTAPALRGAARCIFRAWKPDGRHGVQPHGAVYPCHTTGAARILCRLGYATDDRVKATFEHLLQSQEKDGGWRCNTYKFGRGPETAASNPGPTLHALDAFRFTRMANSSAQLDDAVRFLLGHWETRKPLGPCHFGIGSRFLRVEYPFFRYNLFSYVHVLSFFESARSDPRFLGALKELESRLVDGKIVVEHSRRELVELRFCAEGRPSKLATKRYREIVDNVSK